MPDLEQAIHTLTGVTAELVREHAELVRGLASDRVAFREPLRDLSGFVATAGVALDRLERQISRLAEITESGFTRMALAFEETQRILAENNRRIEETNAVIRRLLDILARGRGNGEGSPAQ